jgi:PAS domain S-box-containing protein
MTSFADEIGADKDEFMKALEEVPVMSTEHFEKVSQMLFAFAKDLSDRAYTNLKQKNQADELERTISLLKVNEEYLSTTLLSIGDGVITTDANGLIVSLNPTAENFCEWKLKDARGKPLEQIFRIIDSETRRVVDNPVKKVIATGKIQALGNHTVLISRSGKEYQIADSAAPIKNKSGAIEGIVLVFSDVTEKYNAQEKIRKSEKQFHNLFENMIEGVAFHELTFDPNGEVADYLIAEVNSSFEKQLGIKKADVVGKTSKEAYGVADPPYLDIYAKVAKAGKPVFFETYFSPMDKHFSISVYRTKENGFATIFDDITANKKAQQELKENEERWKRAIASSPVPILVHDEDGKILQVSSGWTNYSGYTMEDIPTLADWTENAYGKRSGLAKEYIDQLFTIDKTKKNGEWVITAKDGSKRIWDFQATPLGKDKNGRRVLHSMAIDITEQKQAEEELRKSEQQLQFVLKGGQLGFWDWNLETNEVNRNERWAEMLGYNLADIEVSVKQWTDFIHPDDVQMAQKSIQDHLDGKTARHQLEYRMRKKDGEYIWIQDQAQAVKWDSSGRVIRMSGTHTDITDRKKAEEEISIQNEKLERLNSEKDKFCSIIAHDLKNPFNSILGFSQLLAEKTRDRSIEPDESEYFANLILNSSNRVMDLLTNLMEWSRSQTGRMIFNPVEFDLYKLIQNIELLFAESSKQKSISITNEVAPGILIFADTEMISTIFRNLISNAIKFTPSGGSITISAEQKPEEIIVKVSDTGIGIPKSARQTIFSIGGNHSTRGTQNEEGTGLGLILCREFVEKLGGKIWVESELGKGSEFTFTIPDQHQDRNS